MKKPGILASVTGFFDAVAEYVTAADIVRADKEGTELAKRQANIRVAALRERFRAVRELSERMNAHLDEYKDRRAG
jgi:uncharacterized protein (DUF342 family)